MRTRFALPIAAILLSVCGLAQAATYEIEVVNLTKGQTFTPLLVVTHKPAIGLFDVGTAASPELEIVAESGMIGPLEALLGTLPNLVQHTNTNGGLLLPGATTRITVQARGSFNRLSLVGMLIPTNDTFVGLDSVPLPRGGMSHAYALAYDAGTEENDQNCANIPGPRCMGQGLSKPADTDEGQVYVGNGFHDLGTDDGMKNEILLPGGYDWRNPVAKITIRNMGSGGDPDDEDDEDSD